MRRIPAIKSVMTAFPYSVDVNQTVHDANAFLQQHQLGHLPVTNKDELLGVISKRDIHFYLQQESDGSKKRLCDIPIAQKYVVDLNEGLNKVLKTMADGHLDSALVTRQGRLVGIFTLSDVCRNFARFLEEQYGPPNGNEAA